MGRKLGKIIQNLIDIENYGYFVQKISKNLNICEERDCAILGVFREAISDSIEHRKE